MVPYTLFTELLQPPEIGGERFFGGCFGDPIPVGIEVVGGSSVLPSQGLLYVGEPYEVCRRQIQRYSVLGPGWWWRRTKLSNSTVAV